MSNEIEPNKEQTNETLESNATSGLGVISTIDMCILPK